MTRRFCALLMCAFSIALAGCAGYRLGPAGGETSGARSIQINPFANKTLEPRLADYMMGSLRKNLMQDGTYRVDTHDEGDVILTGELVDYHRRQLSAQPNDVLTVLDYEITVTAKITARERNSGKVILEHSVIGRTAVRAGSDLTSAERQAMPLLTDDIAKKTTSFLVDGTW